MRTCTRSLVLLGSIFVSGISFAFAENFEVSDYKKTYDNIPANWEEFYLSDGQIDAGKGETIDKVYMTRLTHGQSGDATILAVGHWFTVISDSHILIKDENEDVFLIQTQGKCREFKRLKHIFLGNNTPSYYYKKNGRVQGLTRFNSGLTSGAPYGGCDIDRLYKWNGPTYFLANINRLVRNYDLPKTRRGQTRPILRGVGH